MQIRDNGDVVISKWIFWITVPAHRIADFSRIFEKFAAEAGRRKKT